MKQVKRIGSILLALLLLLSLAAVAVSAAPASANKKRAIGIVFDNSGSMYLPEGGDEDCRKAWCRATYAMEAFATMMNPQDVMQIYPMHEITVGGTAYNAENPLVITRDTAATVREIYTPEPDATPIETIQAAYDGLVATDGEEKWLIILTDGTSFYEGNRDLRGATVGKLEEVLNGCIQGVNIMYLGIGANAAMPANVAGAGQYYADKAKSSTEVLEKLSAMCNTIFGRDALPNAGKTVEFDVSMSKLILFVQGAGIKDVTLGGKPPVSVNELHYGTQGGGGQAKDQFRVDETLQGTMVTYHDMDAGKYDLTFSGTADNVVCYYEPDVDLKVELLDAGGNPVDPNGELIAGTYLLSYGMVDKYGNPVDSPLLGQTNYTVNYTQGGQAQSLSVDKADKLKLELKPGEELDASVGVVYLDGYTIHKTSADFGWPTGGLKFIPPPAGMLEATISGGAAEYKLSKLTEGEAFRVDFIYEGQKLTGADLAGMEEVQAVLEGGNAKAVVQKDDNGYYVTLAPYDVMAETDCRGYELQVSGIYRNQDGLHTNRAFAAAEFRIADDSRKLGMKIATPQTFYELKKLGEGQPITLKFDFSGDPLTEEELKALTVTTESQGVTFLQEVAADDSAILLRLDPQNPPAEGKFRVDVLAKGVNEVGTEQECKGRFHVETSAMPRWLKILIPILIGLLVLGLILAYANMKVLPKDVILDDVYFNVDGEQIDGGSADIDNPGKKKSDIVVRSPAFPIVPGSQQTMRLSVVAVTNRMTKSPQRRYQVVEPPAVANATQVTSWELNGVKYVQDYNAPGQFVAAAGREPFKEMIIGPSTPITIKAETIDGSAVTFRCTLRSM